MNATHSAFEVFRIFLRLGLTSFGGPVAHLGYFRTEFVERRKWLSESAYADLVALCQFLPGPASSQVGIGIGVSRAGMRGALAAWTGFTMPSAILLILFALGVASLGDGLPAGVLQGLKVVAVAVVAQAVWGMARSLCPDGPRATLAVVAACCVLAFPTALGQIGVILLGGLIGLALIPAKEESEHSPLPIRIGVKVAIACLILFLVLLIGLPLAAAVFPNQTLALFDSFYRSGSLVFGGGHVVLPLLQAEVVPPGWVSDADFLAGYGAAQAVPGPLFTFSAYLGASMTTAPSGWLGGMICLVAIFVPSFLLVIGAVPFWEKLRRNRHMRSALVGINAAVVGLLLAALYHPVWTSAIHAPQDFGLGLIAFAALVFWKVPPWAVVIGGALGGWLVASVI